MINKLKELSVFKHLDFDFLNSAISNGLITVCSYKKGKTIHQQQSKCKGMDIIYDGKIIAYSLSIKGSETIMFEFKSGNIIGANLLFGDNNRYPMNIYCSTDCTIFHISKRVVEFLLKDSLFVKEFVRVLSLNSQGMNEKIAMHTQKSLRENLIDYFNMLASKQQSNNIELPISKKQLADYLGVKRPSLFRELKKMKDEHIISINNKTITLVKT